jgi:hypothetical protein
MSTPIKVILWLLLTAGFSVFDLVTLVLWDFHLFNAASGQKLWQFTVGRGVYAPVVANGMVYIDGFRSKEENDVLFAVAIASSADVSTGTATPVETPR